MKNKEKIVIIITLFCLLTCVLLAKFISNNKNKNTCGEFDFDDILLEINLATGNIFNNFEVGNFILPIPVEIENSEEYLVSYNVFDENNYFAIVKNLDSINIANLKKYVESQENKIVFGEKNEYVYIIADSENEGAIEGIIRSFIYCE